MRVVSLLPAATEIVFGLGLGEQLVAVSHDCDYPVQVESKPRITHCEIHDAGLSSAEVDAWVRDTLLERGTIYTIDEPLLRELQPDLILTQQLCDVCAPSYGSVAQMAATLERPPQLANLEPSSLADIFTDIRTVARLLEAEAAGEELVSSLQERVDRVRERTQRAQPVRCLLIEWLEPLYCSGHWGPELVQLAGGLDPVGRRGQDSVRIDWGDVLDAQPDVLLIAACGNSVQQTLAELPLLTGKKGWSELPAAQAGEVYLFDGSAYFSRPGPRIVDSLELLAGALHPELFPEWRAEKQPGHRVQRL